VAQGPLVGQELLII